MVFIKSKKLLQFYNKNIDIIMLCGFDSVYISIKMFYDCKNQVSRCFSYIFYFFVKLFQNKLNYKPLLYIYIILLIISGPRRSKMETPNYTLYEPTFDPNELKREMAKLAINRDSVNSDDETKEKTEEDVSREMNPYWRVQSLVDNLAGKASAESALVHHEVPYMLRSLINPRTIGPRWTPSSGRTASKA